MAKQVLMHCFGFQSKKCGNANNALYTALYVSSSHFHFLLLYFPLHTSNEEKLRVAQSRKVAQLLSGLLVSMVFDGNQSTFETAWRKIQNHQQNLPFSVRKVHVTI
jgi:hypothetical protein